MARIAVFNKNLFVKHLAFAVNFGVTALNFGDFALEALDFFLIFSGRFHGFQFVDFVAGLFENLTVNGQFALITPPLHYHKNHHQRRQNHKSNQPTLKTVLIFKLLQVKIKLLAVLRHLIIIHPIYKPVFNHNNNVSRFCRLFVVACLPVMIEKLLITKQLRKIDNYRILLGKILSLGCLSPAQIYLQNGKFCIVGSGRTRPVSQHFTGKTLTFFGFVVGKHPRIFAQIIVIGGIAHTKAHIEFGDCGIVVGILDKIQKKRLDDAAVVFFALIMSIFGNGIEQRHPLFKI